MDFLKCLDTEQRNFARGRKLTSEIISTSKEGVSRLREDWNTDVGETVARNRGLWAQLLELELVEDQRWRFLAEAGQEMIELEIVAGVLPRISSFEEELLFPAAFIREGDWPQIYFAGLGDAITELGKLVIDFLAKTELPIWDKMLIRRRFVQVAEAGYEYLESFSSRPHHALDNARGVPYEQTFMGRLMRIGFVIEQHKTQLAALGDFIAFQKSFLENLRRISFSLKAD